MELIIKILIALGSLNSPADFTDAYASENREEVDRAVKIYETNSYREETGGVVVVTGVGV